jgi:hypothetical protein
VWGVCVRARGCLLRSSGYKMERGGGLGVCAVLWLSPYIHPTHASDLTGVIIGVQAFAVCQ